MTQRTLTQWYRWAKAELAALPVDFPETEALILCEHYFGINGRAALTVHGGDLPSEDSALLFEQAVGQRRSRPLQYILGEWEFCGMKLAVGEGVLVPREDTMALVELAAEALEGIEKPRVLDLCAGSGAVALGIKQLIPSAELVCVELSEQALPYLRRNLQKYAPESADIVIADVLKAPCCDEKLTPKGFDIIVSNPPYIPTADLDTLSREVHQEPQMALDGGGDGLDFYRAITELWTPLLREGGALAFELGIGQFSDVKRIFVRKNANRIALKRDFSGVKRAIIGTFGIL